MSLEYPEIDFVLGALAHYEIEVLWYQAPFIYLKDGAEIKVEAPNRYKFIDQKAVIAPFEEVNDLCQFIVSVIQKQVKQEL